MLRSVTTVVLLVALAGTARGQTPCHATVRDLAWASVGTQLAQIRDSTTGMGDVVADGAVCTADSLKRIRQLGPVHFGIVAPVARMAYAGNLPDARNDGPIWTGRGLNVLARAGVTLDWRQLHVTVAPEAGYAQNGLFNFRPFGGSGRSPFASPLYPSPYSADLPTRFGNAPVVQLLPGESAAWVTVTGLDAGVSTSSQAWGAGLRGHLLLGPDAPGVPRVFARTSHPINTPAGSFSGSAFLGVLTESPYFNTDTSDTQRALSGWTVAWSPGPAMTTVIGVAHLGMQAGSPWRTLTNGAGTHGPVDQMNSLYARTRSADDGFRAWVEIARAGALPTMRQFFTIPYQGIAYQVGMEKRIPVGASTLLLAGEATNLEQPTDLRGTPTQDFYTSSDIAQGWTQRGRVLGDPIGPGGQSQWSSADWVARGWSAGVFMERVRWNEDAFLRQYLPFPNRHDVTLRGGVRGSVVRAGQEISVELSGGERLNYEFQNGSYIPGYHTVDIALPELRVTITPHLPRR